MDARSESRSTTAKHGTTLERTSDRELVVTRTFDGPARIVWQAWTEPELLKRWWVPKSFGITLVSWDADVRTGGKYRLVFRHGDSPPMEFFGQYREVTPCTRLVWTNEEGADGGQITTVTFEESGQKTRVVVHELYPSKEALDRALAEGSASCEGSAETHAQLDDLLVGLVAKLGEG